MLALPAQAQASGSSWKSVVKSALDRLDSLIRNENISGKSPESGNSDDKSQEKNDQKNKNDKNDKKDHPDENISLDEIEKQAEFASDATGINKDYLMGMLVVESALGQNTGQCTYQEIEEGALKAHENGRLSSKAWETFKKRKKTIQALAEKLNYNYEELKVSCNPPYAGTGGAMGIAQFMPDTWLEYQERIADIVGKDNPDPWNVRDGAVAMALKLSDVPGVTEHDVSSERKASKMYLSGNTSVAYDWYADEAQYWSKNYQKLMA